MCGVASGDHSLISLESHPVILRHRSADGPTEIVQIAEPTYGRGVANSYHPSHKHWHPLLYRITGASNDGDRPP